MSATPDDQPILMIRSERVGFGPIRGDLVATYARWMSDLRITRTLAASCKPMTLEREQDWLEGALKSGDVVFTVYELATLRPIGNVGLHDLDEVLGTAEFGMFIGEPELWNHGYATEITRLMLAYAFDVLGLYNVFLGTYSLNPAAIRAYEKAGFRRIGVRRGAMRIGRQRCDIVYMDAIADDFPPSFLDAVMHPGARQSPP